MIWNEVCEKADMVKEGFLYAVFTDKIFLLKWPLGKNDMDKMDLECFGGDLNKSSLLECRIFNEGFEYRLARTDLGRDWKERLIEDGKDSFDDYFDEDQYLDIDDKKSERMERYCKITATGGGQYELPVEDFKNVMICIRNYVGYYEETGQAYCKDWRMVGFRKGEKENG